MGEDVDQNYAMILKYVDDSKAIKAVKTEDDVEQFQKELNKLYDFNTIMTCLSMQKSFK